MHSTGRIVIIAFLLAPATFADEIIFSIDKSIPDPSVAGLTDTQDVKTSISEIQDLNVTLTISGDATAANGDFYATLNHGDGFAVLLNRVGRRQGELNGYPDNGMSITLDDQAPNGDIHVYRLTLSGNHNTPIDVTYQSPLTGSWAPDGRDVSYSSVFDTSQRTANPLSAFNGLDPNGNWTLFIADVSAGGSSRLESWSLQITPIPEPSTTMMIGVGGFVLASLVARRNSKRHRNRVD